MIYFMVLLWLHGEKSFPEAGAMDIDKTKRHDNMNNYSRCHEQKLVTVGMFSLMSIPQTIDSMCYISNDPLENRYLLPKKMTIH